MAERDYNLFPPIVDSYMPSFAVEDKECQILFSISDYNSLNAISGAEVSIRYQSNNTSALDSGQEYDSVNSNNYIFDKNNGILTIKETALKNGFIANTIYKVQIRLLNEQGNYSEWSTVCLIKGIHKAIIKVPLFEDVNEIGDMVINIGTLDINAIVEPIKIENASKDELFNESIYYYEMYIYKNGAVYEHSGKIYTTDENERNLKYTFKKQLEVNQSYELEILFCTTSNYIQSEKYDFVHTLIDEQMNNIIELQENNEQGYIEAAVSTKDLIPGSYIILRASSLDNFSTWKDIHLFQKGIDNQELIEWTKKEYSESAMDGSSWQNFQDSYVKNKTEIEKQELYIYKDYTVQSGILYKYKIQNYGKGGIRSLETEASAATLCYFDDIFLGDKDFQLKIKYDSNISSPKRNILESKTDTIGGKYPIIRRNGNTKYESFQISGIISAFDNENEFYDNSWKEKDDWQKQYYDKYNISNMRDFIGEKTYRDKVSEFLQNGQIKLFRSIQEGNFLVRLMDISFTPNQQLGRLIYSFSATAYQVADLTIENYFKYNILTPIIYDKKQNIISTEIVFGQEKGEDLSVIRNKYNRQYFFNNYGYKTMLNKFNKVKITAITEWPISNSRDNRLHPGQSIILTNNDIDNFTIPEESVIEYEAEIEITYIQDAYKTQYISYNIGQLYTNQEILSEINKRYMQTEQVDLPYYQEIERILAINFNNQSDQDCNIKITYEDTKTTNINIKRNSNYLLTSDILETKAIKSIEPQKNAFIYVDYYYEFSKKYYFKEE